MMNHELESVAAELANRLVSRGRVPASLRKTIEEFLLHELRRTMVRIARKTSENCGVLVACSRGDLL